ncbi:Uncharacterized protein Adt_13584 [Abeliophyllum distichum]|uniref:Uncharacterized protein n=1 Tax=Abeliophyllum distichum TaxID=126358 RepID=A0ABD1TX83_9LAMI
MGCPMRILKWTCDFHPDAETPLLMIDEATADLLRPSEARVCVEVNLEHKLPDRIWIDRGESLPIGDRTGKGKRKEVVVEATRQWAPVVGSSSIVDIPPPVVHVGATHQLKHTIPTIVASKSFHDFFSSDLLLDHMMSVPREFSILLEPMQPVFYNEPHVNPRLSCHKNVETLIPLDTTSSTQLEVHQPGHFRRNSSNDFAGLDERQETDGFTTVQRKKFKSY